MAGKDVARSAVAKYEAGAAARARGRNTPFINQAGKDFTDANAGTMKVFNGDIKGGAKQIMASGISSVTGGPLWAMNQPPDPTYIGGSAEALDARRQQQTQGIGQGMAYTAGGMDTANAGANMIGGAYGYAGQDRATALNLSSQGYQLGNMGIAQQQAALGRQNAQLGQMLSTAQQQGPSAAQAQLQMGLDQSRRAMMAQAANARGGNAAAAMRTAQANGMGMAGQVNQQAAVLRAQEQAQHQAQLLQAQQFASGAYGGQQAQMGNTAALGYGMQGQGLGLAQGSTGQMGQMGANVGSIGLGQASAGNQMQGNYLGAQTATDKAQLDADNQQESAKQASKGGVMGLAGKVIGSIF